jgi:hypothetical protein
VGAGDNPLWTELRQWLANCVAERGVLGAARYAVGRTFELLRDYSPARRRLRYGDLEYDWEHGVDTTWANIPLRTRLREIFTEGQYQPVDTAPFHESIGRLPIDFGEFVFVDLGSGKGRALLLASDYPFRRIVGVEIIPELHAVAGQNIAKYASPSQQCRNICLLRADAREFVFPEEPTVLYLFNPFPRRVLQEVLERFRESLTEHPRRAVIVYHNPVLQDVFDSKPWLKKMCGTQQYAVYEFAGPLL